MTEFNDRDAKFMHEAITLAVKGLGTVSPNPPVGCVIVKNGRIIGRGYHQKFGEAHAEVNALADALGNTDGDVAGATAYVTLMPCNHYGKTPPCAEALLRAEIARVVAAVEDPNPQSSGGAETLRSHGVQVDTGLLAPQASKVMAGFLKFYRSSLPYVLLKYAMTLDGKIAHPDGSSKWISSDRSRDYVQTLRMQADAVLVGSGTAIQDQPRLNVRNAALPQPKRVIIDSQLRLTADMPLFNNPGGDFIIIHALANPGDKAAALAQRGITLVACPQTDGGSAPGKVNLQQALKILAADFGVRNVLCEGGARLNAALLQNKLADAAAVFVAPKILGGSGLSPTEGDKTLPIPQAPRLIDTEVTTFDRDVFIRGVIEYNS